MNWNTSSSSSSSSSYSWGSSSTDPYATSTYTSSFLSTEEISGLPASINPETRGRLNNVRQELWTGSLRGLVFGLGLGYAGHRVATRIPVMRAKLRGPNSLVLTTFICGTTCSYIGAVVYGQNAFSYLVDLFKAEPKPDTLMVAADSLLMQQKPSTYQSQLIQNDRELIERFEHAFVRRAEAIQKAKQQSFVSTTDENKKQDNPYSPSFPSHLFSNSTVTKP